MLFQVADIGRHDLVGPASWAWVCGFPYPRGVEVRVVRLVCWGEGCLVCIAVMKVGIETACGYAKDG